MSALAPLLLLFLFTLVIASAHAVMRPVVNEYYFIHQPRPKTVPNVVHSDGYVDNLEEDELTFSKESDAIIRRRSLEGKSHDY
jgi:hypothetical protein